MFNPDKFTVPKPLGEAEREKLLLSIARQLRNKVTELACYSDEEIALQIKKQVGMNSDYFAHAAAALKTALRTGGLRVEVKGDSFRFKVQDE